jgi:hypothetical protein
MKRVVLGRVMGKRIIIRNTPRSDDEIVLAAVRLRTAGHGAAAIGEALGLTPERVRVMTNRVLNADLAESGDADVLAGYWR